MLHKKLESMAKTFLFPSILSYHLAIVNDSFSIHLKITSYFSMFSSLNSVTSEIAFKYFFNSVNKKFVLHNFFVARGRIELPTPCFSDMG